MRIRTTLGLAVALALLLSACGENQTKIEELQSQVRGLKSQVASLENKKKLVLAHLYRAATKRDEAYSQLSWARTNVSLLRDKVAGLEQTFAEQEIAAEPYSYADTDTSSDPSYSYGSDPYSDSYGGSYGSDLDCDDYSYDNFDPGAGDPYGLDADGDGVACESGD